MNNKLIVILIVLTTIGMASCSDEKSMCPDDNHPHMIDLGLPNGTKWACCNVGAAVPQESGGYYAWGETKVKSSYNTHNYEYPGYIGDISGTEYDVAYSQWGSQWCMPTVEQIYELLVNTEHKWTTYQGVNGYKFTGSNGESIFIPAAGYITDSRMLANEVGFLWSSMRDDLDDDKGMIRYSKYLDIRKIDASVSITPIEAALNVRPVSNNK